MTQFKTRNFTFFAPRTVIFLKNFFLEVFLSIKPATENKVYGDGSFFRPFSVPLSGNKQVERGRELFAGA